MKLSGKCELMHGHHFAHFRLAKFRRMAKSLFFVRMKGNENSPTVSIVMSIGEIFLEGNLAFFYTL